MLRSFLYKVSQNPFKYYCRAAGTTFCLTAITNTATAFFDEPRREFLGSHPQLFFGGILLKSAQFGLIFPAFYLTALRSPRQAFYLGGSIDEGIKAVSEEMKRFDAIESLEKQNGDVATTPSKGSYNYSSTSVTRNGETVTTTTVNGKTTITTKSADGKVTVRNID
ncbi:hypothetical protein YASMINEVIRUS_1598 [Yasminevirus sp. GU-2018]|uniref:Uncharacterized protein n=1 Tax=Yasminevirus sp. GU-2018 TaxID=2420051 RepID=A0A5K0UCE1_9VIRU|nr:hypothetical protein YASMINEVIRUS_1598 [Yasminevirus sp. GU-2018]